MSEERLSAVFAAPAAPARDARFVMAVMERAEAERWRAETRLAVLRGAGMAAGAIGVLVLGADWLVQRPDALQAVLLAAAGLLTALSAARVRRMRFGAG